MTSALAAIMSLFYEMIRLVTENDIPEIISLMKSIPGFWQSAWRSDALERAICLAEGLAYVWVEDNQIVGFVCGHDLGFRGYLSTLVVADAYRNRGIGKRLVNEVENELSERGCSLIVADIWKEAEKFYSNLGWSPPDVILVRKKLL